MEVMRANGPLVELSAFQVSRVSRADGRLVVRGKEPGRTDAPPPWLSLERVPAGRYGLDLQMSHPRMGQLLVKLNGDATPLLTLSSRAETRQRVEMQLPVGVADLAIEPGPELTAVRARVQLEPIETRDRGGFAKRQRAFGPARIFFMDDNAFVEERGFWVQGGRSTSMTLISEEGVTGRPLRLNLQNGRAPNTIRIETPSSKLDQRLAPLERHAVELPFSDGALPVTITASAGFRPSDSGSSDRRFLGVWVEPVVQNLTAAPNQRP
jgi:hypothetical protein